jgi:hypothetical protein
MLFLLATLSGCTNEATYTEKDFVGKWKSSRMSTPLYMYENGEWEFKTDDDTVKLYGVWQFYNKKILWTDREEGLILHDLNPVISMNKTEFKLKESDGTISTFRRIQ